MSTGYQIKDQEGLYYLYYAGMENLFDIVEISLPWKTYC